jgi:CheY-like chemotaxis protein
MMKNKLPARVLVIDNDEINRFIATKLLARVSPGTVVDSCNNGHEALELLRIATENNDKFPEYILLDLTMPVMDGWEFLDEYEKLYIKKPVSVIVLTSSIFQRDMDRAQKHAVPAQFISKPLTSEYLENLFFKS